MGAALIKGGRLSFGMGIAGPCGRSVGIGLVGRSGLMASFPRVTRKVPLFPDRGYAFRNNILGTNRLRAAIGLAVGSIRGLGGLSNCIVTVGLAVRKSRRRLTVTQAHSTCFIGLGLSVHLSGVSSDGGGVRKGKFGGRVDLGSSVHPSGLNSLGSNGFATGG